MLAAVTLASVPSFPCLVTRAIKVGLFPPVYVNCILVHRYSPVALDGMTVVQLPVGGVTFELPY